MSKTQENAILSFQDEYRWLSNFWPVEEHRTTEHFFQACKTLVRQEQHEILRAQTPGQAKRLGRKVTLRPDWEEIKLDVMLNLTRLKFLTEGPLKNHLFLTGNRYLYEGNTWGDFYWGVDLERLKAGTVLGENNLGKIIMRVRGEIEKATEVDSWMAFRELEWYMTGGSGEGEQNG